MNYPLTIGEALDTAPLTELNALYALVESESDSYYERRKNAQTPKELSHCMEMFDTLSVVGEIIQNEIIKRRESYFKIMLPNGENAFEQDTSQPGWSPFPSAIA